MLGYFLEVLKVNIGGLWQLAKALFSQRKDLSFSQKPMRYFNRLGAGRAVSVYVSDDDLAALVFRFERKVESSDIKDGRLVPLAREDLKRRGGKRVMHYKLSYESAEALHSALGAALSDIRARRSSREFLHRMFSFVAAHAERLQKAHPA
ncbi:MAG: hypothetical protein AAB417_03540 [Patescibacteria group bacterium]